MKNDPIFLTSRANPTVVATAKLQDKKHRVLSQSFFAEGEKLLWEAIASGAPISYVMVTEDAYARLSARDAFSALDCPVYVVNVSIFEKISTEKSPEGVLCVIKDIDFLHKRYIIYGRDSFCDSKIVLSGVRDPGNLGTMLRTADAFGIGEVILSADCADLYHPKTVRAAMGALFRIKVSVCADVCGTLALLSQNGYRTYAATLRADSIPLPALSVNERTCFVIGNEGHGLDADVIAACDASVIIPMQEGAESLNAATAASVLMWEIARAR